MQRGGDTKGGQARQKHNNGGKSVEHLQKRRTGNGEGGKVHNGKGTF